MNKLEEQRLLHKLFIIALLGFDINYVNKHSLGFYLKSNMVNAVIGLFPEDECFHISYRGASEWITYECYNGTY